MNIVFALIMASGISFGVFYAIGNLSYKIFKSETIAWVFGLLSGIFIFVMIWKKFYNLKNKSSTQTISTALGALRDAKDRISSSIDEADSQLYAITEEELQNGKIDKGLWAQALVKSNGNEEKRKSEYIKLRVKQLKNKINKKVR